MINYCALDIRNVSVRRFIAGVLSLVIIAATLSDAIAHIGFDLAHTHSVSHHQDPSSAEVKSSNLEDCCHSKMNSPCLDTHAETSDKDQKPTKTDCQFGCEAHLCLTAILIGSSEVTIHRINKSFLKPVSHNIRSFETVDLFRPPIYFL